MDSNRDQPLAGDLSALAWVQDELRRTLDQAHKALRRHLRELEQRGAVEPDGEAVVPTAVLQARTLIHQGAGALHMIGLPAAARVLAASEQAVARLADRAAPFDEAAVQAVEQASFALLDYLRRALAGQPESPLTLFPQYQAVLAIAKAERIHPADLWEATEQAEPVPTWDSGFAPLEPDPQVHAAIESAMLKVLRHHDSASLQRMSDLFAGLSETAEGRAAALWQLASAFFEGQAVGALKPDLYTKRLVSRLLAQLRAVERGATDGPARLLRDLRFFCAQARPMAGEVAPRLAQVRAGMRLGDAEPVDYTRSPLGRFDPALLPLARRRVAALKESWSALVAGDAALGAAVPEQGALVAESVRQLYPRGDGLAEALLAATQRGSAPSPAMAMEVATALLCVDASLDDVDLAGDAMQERVQRLADRLSTVHTGGEQPPVEPWMEALYREVSDRQTMGSVVQELRASLAEVEQRLDRFSRHPDDREALGAVPGALASMRGVLSVLGLDQASHAVQRMREDIEAVMAAPADASEMALQLVDNVGALSFMIDMLGVQPQLAKSLFRFDAATGRFAAVMGHARAAEPTLPTAETELIEQVQTLADSATDERLSDADLSRTLDSLTHHAVAADAPQLAEKAAQARDALTSATNDAERDAARAGIASSLGEFVARQEMTPPPESPRSRPMPLDDEPDDMREIFFEEAREVVETARAALQDLENHPQDLEALTTVRRAFHTLKGSSRMVGLRDYGEAAWACEQLYNTRLAEAQAEADTALRDFSGRALDSFAQWVESLAEGRGELPDHGRALVAEAHALRLRQPVATAPAPAPTPAPAPVPAPAPAAPAADAVASAAETLPMDLAPEPEPPAPAPLLGADAFELPADEPTTFRLPPATAAPSPAAVEWASTAEVPLFDALASSRGDGPATVDLELDLSWPQEPVAADAPTTAPMAAAEPAADAAEPEPDHAERYKVVGPLRIQIALFNIFLNEADEQSRRLGVEIAEWQHELPRPVSEAAIALAHSLAGNSAAVGYSDLSNLARRLEHGLERSAARGMAHAAEVQLFADVAEEIRRLLHQFAAGFLKPVAPELLARLDAHEAHEAQEALAAGRSELAPLEADVAEPVDLPELASPDQADEPLPLPECSELPADAALAAEPVESMPEPTAEPISETAPEPTAGTISQPTPEPMVDGLPAAETQADEPAPVPAEEDLAVNAPAVEAAEDTGETHATRQAPLGAVRFTALDEPAAPAEERPLAAAPAARDAVWGDIREDLDTEDAIDEELIAIFMDEGRELLPALAEAVREWEAHPAQEQPAVSAMRVLHTLKGSARLAGAMRLGEIAHRLETAIGVVRAQGGADAAVLAQLFNGVDALAEEFERLQAGPLVADTAAPAATEGRDAGPAAVAAPAVPTLTEALPTVSVVAVDAPAMLPAAGLLEPFAAPAAPTPSPASAGAPAQADAAGTPAAPTGIDWARFVRPVPAEAAALAGTSAAEAGSAIVRVRAPLLERLVTHAGEVGIARARIETDMTQLQGALKELTDNLDRLRRQLRDLELQAETQMASRMEAARQAHQAFDPLEMDRFTRVQELTRMLAESVGDVGTVQRGIQQTLQSTEDQLAVQARLTRELQDDLLRARMVQFDTLSDRLYRVVRQAAKESGKQVRLNLVGGAIELDRSVLDRMAPAFEHLLRNAVVHGIESPALRQAVGKDAAGQIEIVLQQAGNEVRIDVRDDGAGLNLARIADRARQLGVLSPDARPTEAELAGLIFQPGFSTADQVTELAGRGVGMDVVRAEVTSLGGRIETASATGRGTAFQLLLPLTTAVTQVVALACGELQVAVPATLVETVRRVPVDEVEAAYRSGLLRHGDQDLPFFWLGSLLQHGVRGTTEGRTASIVIARSADQRVALHVSQIVGNQEVVVKNLGPQLARLPGLAGMSLLANGETVLIYNPVALATVYGADARQRLLQWQAGQAAGERTPEPAADLVAPVTEAAVPREENRAPLVLVVDDSLTVRRVTQRLLQREGYRVTLARDGLDALEKLADERPAVMLSDIEMPRMDGFDLVRNVRGDARLHDLPVVMITSRIAQKHREHAQELGVDHYLGKPYDEEALLALVRSYAYPAVPA
ncbi:Hpt domain-containing protein [Ideonella sp.]|uniref:hybrid sensor histidine kinase/response regulator n=1 Tax=Ideonella sp. TaxID=1929293 RepID=UPI0035B27DFE